MDDIFNIENNSNQTVSFTTSGDIVKMQYSAILTICDDLEIIKNDLIEQWQTISGILQDKDSIWQGDAATKFFNGISKVNSSAIETTEGKALPGHIQRVRELVELNKQVDSQLNDINLSTVDETAPNVQANSAGIEATGVNSELNESVKTNDNILGNDATTDAIGVNEELNDSVSINDNVQSNNSMTDANGINTELNDSVNIGGNVQSNNATVVANGIDEELINSVNINNSIF